GIRDLYVTGVQTCALPICTAGLKHSLCNPEERSAFVEGFRNTLPIMEKIDCPTMIVLSGNKVPGLSPEAHHQSCIDGLKAAVARSEERRVGKEGRTRVAEE